MIVVGQVANKPTAVAVLKGVNDVVRPRGGVALIYVLVGRANFALPAARRWGYYAALADRGAVDTFPLRAAQYDRPTPHERAHCTVYHDGAMPNQTILMLRVAVTLSCLVGVPAVALVGIRNAEPTALRTGADRDTGRTPPVRGAERGDATRATTDGAGAVAAEASKAAPRATIRDVAAAEAVDDGRSAVNAAGYDEAVGAPSAGNVDRLTASLQRLQQLGAEYYRLESSPQAAAEFNFHCRVAGFERPFEAADAVAANAVARVVREIEAARRNVQRPPDRSESRPSIYLR